LPIILIQLLECIWKWLPQQALRKGMAFSDESLSPALLAGRDRSSALCFKSGFANKLEKISWLWKSVVISLATLPAASG